MAQLTATDKHPYMSEGATIEAYGFDERMLIDRGYAVYSDGQTPKPKAVVKTNTPKPKKK